MKLFLGLLSLTCLSIAQPDPREIPVPKVATKFPVMPGVSALPAVAELPNVLTMRDGKPVKTAKDWARRRAEMREILAYYAVGHAPPPPGNVKGRLIKQEPAGDSASYRLIHLTFGPGEKLGFDIGIFTPAGKGPFPAFIMMSGTPPGAIALERLPRGPLEGRGKDVLMVVGRGEPAPAGAPGPPIPPAATVESMAKRFEAVLQRGYALAVFNPNDCAEDTTLRNADGSWAFRTTRFYPAYPGYDWGILAGWAWGASRIADYLEKDASIDSKKLIVTGASRYGKASMVAAAFDDRLMGAPVVTGGGGMGAYRFAGPRKSETLDVMQMKYPNWFSPNLHEFWGSKEKLPFDQHWFLALAAPRPFIALEGITDTISLPEAVKQSINAALPAYALLGAREKLGANYANHGHAFTAEDWTAMLDFFDWHLKGKSPGRTYDRFPNEAELDAALAASKKP